jgi:hypothetical protein
MRAFDKRRSRLDDAQDFLARRGGMPVLLGRWATVEKAIGRDGALIAVAVVLVAVVVWKVRETPCEFARTKVRTPGSVTTVPTCHQPRGIGTPWTP